MECGDRVPAIGQYCYETPTIIANEDEFVVCLGGGDANGDGYGDIVFGQEGVAAVVSLGTEKGGFGPPLSVDALAPSVCAIRDFAGDGRVELGGRAGGFGLWQVTGAQSIELALTEFAFDGSANHVAAADFNGDGVLDMLVGTSSSGASDRVVPVISAPALDGLDAVPGFVVGDTLVALAGGDINGDGLDDAVWVSTSAIGSAQISAMLGTADPVAPVSLEGIYEAPPGVNIRDIAVAQVLGSTAADIVFVQGEALFALAGDGALGFSEPEQIPTSAVPTAIASAELDGTEGGEIAVVYEGLSELTLVGASPEGPRLEDVRLPFPGFLVDATDANNDGADEVLIAAVDGGPVMVLVSDI